MPQVYRSHVRCNLGMAAGLLTVSYLTLFPRHWLLTPKTQLKVWVTRDHTRLCPNISVDFVSASLKTEGEQQMTMVVLQFPPKESWRIRVILLSRYGTCVFYLGKKKKYWLLQPNQRKKHRGKQVSDGDTMLRKTHETIICCLVFGSFQSLDCLFWDPAHRKLPSPFAHFNEPDLPANSASTASTPSVPLQMNTN